MRLYEEIEFNYHSSLFHSLEIVPSDFNLDMKYIFSHVIFWGEF